MTNVAAKAMAVWLRPLTDRCLTPSSRPADQVVAEAGSAVVARSSATASMSPFM
jgi:hypothetical protein